MKEGAGCKNPSFCQDFITDKMVQDLKFVLPSLSLYFCLYFMLGHDSAKASVRESLHLCVSWRLGDSLKETRLSNHMKSTPPPTPPPLLLSHASKMFVCCLFPCSSSSFLILSVIMTD